MSDIALRAREAVPAVEGITDHAEIQKQDEVWFDLTPVEKKLCASSLGLGVLLLLVSLVVFRLS